MKYIDRIYGEFEINEPVVLEIMESPEMQRLKGVDQDGYMEPFFPGVSHERFEHSIGTYLLLKKYNAPFKEQIAGLIHDISHPVFSHAGDFYFKSGSTEKQSHQDDSFEEFVKKSSLPKIFEKYNLNLKYILNDKNFPLKEKELPDICADRIDYSLREMVIFKIGKKEEAEYFLKKLKVENFRWIFDDFESAQKYARRFEELNRKYYSSFTGIMAVKAIGDCIKYSLEKKYLSISDLYTTDKKVIKKILNYSKKDKILKSLFDKANNKIKFKNDPDDYKEKIICKSRVIDPFCKHSGKIMRVSEINLDWKKIVEEEMKPKEYFLKFLE